MAAALAALPLTPVDAATLLWTGTGGSASWSDLANWKMQGFSSHAAARCGADDRQSLERLCHHIAGPALGNARVLCNAVGRSS